MGLVGYVTVILYICILPTNIISIFIIIKLIYFRHLDNILIDGSSGGAVHVDFNCLFLKGCDLGVPELGLFTSLYLYYFHLLIIYYLLFIYYLLIIIKFI